jgi:hypothetical protein
MQFACVRVGAPLVVKGVHVEPDLELPITWNRKPWQTYWIVSDEGVRFRWQYLVDFDDQGRTVHSDLCQIGQSFSPIPAIANMDPRVDIENSTYSYADGCGWPGRGEASFLPTIGIPLTLRARILDDSAAVLALDGAPTTFQVKVVRAGLPLTWRQPLTQVPRPASDRTVEYAFAVQQITGNDGSLLWENNFSNRLKVTAVHAVRGADEFRIRQVRFGDNLSCFQAANASPRHGVSIRACNIGEGVTHELLATPAYRLDTPANLLNWSIQFDADPASPFKAPPPGDLIIQFDILAEGIPPPPPSSPARTRCLHDCETDRLTCLAARNPRPTANECATGYQQCAAVCPAH